MNVFPWGICRRQIQLCSFSGAHELPGMRQVRLGHSFQLPVLRDVWSFVSEGSTLPFLGAEQLGGARGALAACSCPFLKPNFTPTAP